MLSPVLGREIDRSGTCWPTSPAYLLNSWLQERPQAIYVKIRMGNINGMTLTVPLTSTNTHTCLHA